MLVITPTFTADFETNFGVNAAAARDAWFAAADVFTTHLTDDIHINITVDAAAGTNVFGQSSVPLLSISYADLLARVMADATTQDDGTAIGPGGSMTAADPTNGAGTWWLTRSQAKALGQIPDDLSEDGTTRFGAGNAFTFSGTIAPNTYDFQGVAAHEISEVMGRLGISGGTIGATPNSFSLIDNFSYTGSGTKGLRGGPGNYFSIDNGTTLLKLFNDPTANGLDSRDWAPGTNDAFNQFSESDVVNTVSAVDLQLMDVIGYDLVETGVTRFLVTENGQPNGVTRAHGTFTYDISGIGVDRTKGVLATISEVAIGPSGQFDQPFRGAATMSVLNISPQDNGNVLLWVQVNWPSDLNLRLQLIRVDD
jgi:hypothetical protein